MKNITFSTIIFTILSCSLYTAAQTSATYDINFTSTWNALDHGTLPSNAHWSNLVGTNHNSTISFLEMGSSVSIGIENVAEAGSNAAFNSEVQTEINNGNAEQWLSQSFAPFAAISSATLSNITLSEEFPLITLVSMIAPSPDWIIAVNGLSLWDSNTNTWKDTFTLDLFPYDAGTEDGFGYSGNNAATNPQGVLTSISNTTGYPFNSIKIGTLTITLKNTTLGLNDVQNQNNVNLFPNPSSTGRLTLSNTTDLKDVTIYDMLGKTVIKKSFKTSSQNQILDINTLNKGVYIVRLVTNTGKIESKRLVVN